MRPAGWKVKEGIGACEGRGAGRKTRGAPRRAHRAEPSYRAVWAVRKRTKNMPNIELTLDKSKLSGWLKADAWLNMAIMLVALDVSRLRGWLNEDASCRVKKGKGEKRGATCGLGGGRAWGSRGASSVQEGPDCGGSG